MQNPEVNRAGHHDFKVRASDRIDVWTSPYADDRWNLTIETGDGDYGQLRLLGFNADQFANLSLQVAEALGRMPEITRQQVQECHEMLGRLLGEPRSSREPPDPPAVNPESDW